MQVAEPTSGSASSSCRTPEETDMARVKRGVTARHATTRSSVKAKGYYNARRKVFRAAKQAVIKAGQYAYRDRRARKREFRALWITRINAAARATGCRTAA